MSADNSFFEEKEAAEWNKIAAPKFEDLRMTRSMKALLRGQENTNPTAAALVVSKNAPIVAGAKRRRRSGVGQSKPLVFKVNPLYEPPTPTANEDEVDGETATLSPSKKRNVSSVKSPHTKEKEMVSAILQLAAYGMSHLSSV